mmetsp:Transcript_30242/g.66138  ORF Transcript_30242/g.66138 Transcript_30242/m.66138 type:complete len:223 (-) Transcript_30242:1369-2037(-)
MFRSCRQRYRFRSSLTGSAEVASSKTASLGLAMRHRAAASRCCSPSERTRVQSATVSKPSSKRLGRSPRPNFSKTSTSTSSLFDSVASDGYSSCSRRSPNGMYGFCGRKSISRISGRTIRPWPWVQSPATARRTLLFPTPLLPTTRSRLGSSSDPPVAGVALGADNWRLKLSTRSLPVGVHKVTASSSICRPVSSCKVSVSIVLDPRPRASGVLLSSSTSAS